MSYDLAVDEPTRALAEKVRDFVDTSVIPHEAVLSSATHGMPDDLRRDLQEQARAAGVFAPTAPTEYGGLGLDHRAIAVILEESGRSLLGPAAMNCSAPDEGNILLLDKVATPEQKAAYLAPLSAGDIRSCFAMTEPSRVPVPTRHAQHHGRARWRRLGHQWTQVVHHRAEGAAFSIVMAKTGSGATMFLVDGDNPGMQVERSLHTMDVSFSGGHGYVVFDDCRVPADRVLGEVDLGFRYAQVRLGPARLTHCMRWLGQARRTHETAVAYAAQRPMFGTTLAGLGMAQQMIADNEIDIAPPGPSSGRPRGRSIRAVRRGRRRPSPRPSSRRRRSGSPTGPCSCAAARESSTSSRSRGSTRTCARSASTTGPPRFTDGRSPAGPSATRWRAGCRGTGCEHRAAGHPDPRTAVLAR
jgi:acyl-CoA dehydrogenase